MITFHSHFPKDIILGRHQIYYKKYLEDFFYLKYCFPLLPIYIDGFDRKLLNNINIYLGGKKKD